MAKRANGEGSIRKRKDGLWECRVLIGYDANGRCVRKSIYAPTKAEARLKAEQYQKSAQVIQQSASCTFKFLKNDLDEESKIIIGFSDWADSWYESYESSVAESTYASYKYTLRILKDWFEDTDIKEILPIDVERFLRIQVDAGKSSSYISKLRAMLFQIMRKAAANQLIQQNPVQLADKVKMTRLQRKPRRFKDSFTKEEIQIMMRDLPHDQIGNSIRFMLGTGIRTQELLALEPRHFADDLSTVTIEQAITVVSGIPKIGQTKSQDSNRIIPIPASLQSVVEELLSLKNPFLVCTSDGHFMQPTKYRIMYRSRMERLSGVRCLTPHCCRHTYVSQLQAAGIPMETIRDLTGHAEIEMTTKYLHVQDTQKKKAVSTLDKYLSLDF